LFEGEYSKWVWIFAIILIAILIFFGAGAGNFITVPGWSMSSDLWTALFFIAIIAAAVFWLGKGDGGDKPAPKT